jgi:hypothetical protein
MYLSVRNLLNSEYLKNQNEKYFDSKSLYSRVEQLALDMIANVNALERLHQTSEDESSPRSIGNN